MEKLKNYDIFVDFGNGDKFYLQDFTIDEEHKKITFKGCQGQMTWVKIDALHPIKMK
jgi:phosphoribosyl 1,2-cyclic phosphodiesterase